MKSKTKKSLRGRALFNAVIKKIESDPKSYDQEVIWHSDCGTKHCLGGWCQILMGKKIDVGTARMDARRGLGIKK